MTRKLSFLFLLIASAWSRPWNRMELKQGDAKLIGGLDTPLHAFPYQACIYFDNRTYFGGALITDRWVLTTAVVANWRPEKPLVILGAQTVANKEFSQQKIQSDEIISHELWNGQFVNNIALLHLDRTAELNRYVNPVMLAPFNAPDFDSSLIAVSGYGWTTTNILDFRFRYLTADGISNSDCKKIRGDVINDGHICIDTTGEKGTCYYDDGDPFLDVDSGLLVGLASGGSCGKGTLDFATRVSYFNKWIVGKIN